MLFWDEDRLAGVLSLAPNDTGIQEIYALLNPETVAVARSAPLGTAGLPLVALSETVMFGVVPVHPLQNRSRSTCVS